MMARKTKAKTKKKIRTVIPNIKMELQNIALFETTEVHHEEVSESKVQKIKEGQEASD